MIKSFYQNMKGKIKIIRKLRPIDNKIKNLSDATSNIVLNMELYKGKTIMSVKDFVNSVFATAKNFAGNMVFPIWSMVALPNLGFPNT